jgi:hypothetical protein
MSRLDRKRLLAHPALRLLLCGVALWSSILPLVAAEGPAQLFGGLFAAWALTIALLALLSRSEESGDV